MSVPPGTVPLRAWHGLSKKTWPLLSLPGRHGKVRTISVGIERTKPAVPSVPSPKQEGITVNSQGYDVPRVTVTTLTTNQNIDWGWIGVREYSWNKKRVTWLEHKRSLKETGYMVANKSDKEKYSNESFGGIQQRIKLWSKLIGRPPKTSWGLEKEHCKSDRYTYAHRNW